ncbi:DUF2065 domain-containing protein [Pseudoalteromonas piratica]|uniref:Membrane protein n=1 Tax=Pseudoalteromonas piratica TaxID=1348114 RepID=A0A0A7EDH8_9GAMM|nr:DUF2065 domain-containing protein [Pseudoalteromonas piratica]AIY64654.1 membrane protein [Pseudoalteromonas piratica]
MNFDVLFLAVGLLLIFEGLGPALFPQKWREYLSEMAQLPDSQLRIIGIVLILSGWLLFMWLKP